MAKVKLEQYLQQTLQKAKVDKIDKRILKKLKNKDLEDTLVKEMLDN